MTPAGEYIGLDVKVISMTKDADKYKHLENSLKTTKKLKEKAAKLAYGFHKKCVENRDFKVLKIYVMELLMNCRCRENFCPESRFPSIQEVMLHQQLSTFPKSV